MTLPGRLGFYYFPDTQHYTQSDLHCWQPELQALGATWLILRAPNHYAIPEPFLNGLVSKGIEPILHFDLMPGVTAEFEHYQLLFQTYARCSIRYVVLFDKPNLRSAWPASAWAQGNLIERFIDAFIPLANLAIQSGLIPVFPPLEPGGDFWDTAFLRAALNSLRRRGQKQIIKNMILGAYAWTCDHPLDWGAGGPERWPGARPYHTPETEQDQRGFRIFDWYLALAEAEWGDTRPIFLIGAGHRLPAASSAAAASAAHAQINLNIARVISGEHLEGIQAVPGEVLACNFWLLSATKKSPHVSDAWYTPEGQPLPVVSSLRQWIASRPKDVSDGEQLSASSCASCSIAHYLLLPSYDWGIADWHLEIIRPFVKKYRPTIGFSLDEAAQAKRVTVLGGSQFFPDDTIRQLRAKGCLVEQIDAESLGDGTQIATILATL